MKQWWQNESDTVHQELNGIVDRIYNNVSEVNRRKNNRLTYQAYERKSLSNDNAALQFTRPTRLLNTRGFNVVYSIGDTLINKMCQSKPVPMALTSGGDYQARVKARNFNKVVKGAFQQAKAFEIAPKIYESAFLWYKGIAHVGVRNNVPVVEFCLPDQFNFDIAEVGMENPTQLHRTHFVNKYKLIEQYGLKPKDIAKLDAAKTATDYGVPAEEGMSDMIRIRESWKLPSSPTSGDGRYVAYVENMTLENIEYDKNYFPFVFLNWGQDLLGMWGQSPAERLLDPQYEISEVARKIQNGFNIGSTLQVVYKNGSNFNPRKLDGESNAHGYDGDAPPQFIMPPAVGQDRIAYFEMLIQMAYQEFGLSQYTASSVKPKGLNSAVSLETYSKQEDGRQFNILESIETFWVEVGRQLIEVIKDLAKENPDLEIKIQGKKFIEKLKYKDLDLDSEDYHLQVYPVSSLPTQPAEREKAIIQRVQAGIIPVEMLSSLLDYPDFEAKLGDKAAMTIEAMEKNIDAILYNSGKRVISPSIHLNLDLAINIAEAAIVQADIAAPEEDENTPVEEQIEVRKEKMAAWIAQAKMIRDQAIAEEMAKQARLQQQMMAMQQPQVPPQGQIPPFTGEGGQ